jgi:hypothetical protein
MRATLCLRPPLPGCGPSPALNHGLEAVDCDRRAISHPLPNRVVGRAGRSTVVLTAIHRGQKKDATRTRNLRRAGSTCRKARREPGLPSSKRVLWC